MNEQFVGALLITLGLVVVCVSVWCRSEPLTPGPIPHLDLPWPPEPDEDEVIDLPPQSASQLALENAWKEGAPRRNPKEKNDDTRA